MKTLTCNSCHAPIVWALTVAGKRMPVDAEPVEHGNLHLYEPVTDPDSPRVIFHDAGCGDFDDPLYTSHFATCPNANQHRRSR